MNLMGGIDRALVVVFIVMERREFRTAPRFGIWVNMYMLLANREDILARGELISFDIKANIHIPFSLMFHFSYKIYNNSLYII